uniref:Uncharacterized protein n=1 Tax=Anguilla anguilla TaxID=7936 RepID=A0A0E9WFL4_ANGAN
MLKVIMQNFCIAICLCLHSHRLGISQLNSFFYVLTIKKINE